MPIKTHTFCQHANLPSEQSSLEPDEECKPFLAAKTLEGTCKTHLTPELGCAPGFQKVSRKWPTVQNMEHVPGTWTRVPDNGQTCPGTWPNVSGEVASLNRAFASFSKRLRLQALPPQQQAALGWLATDPKVWLVASARRPGQSRAWGQVRPTPGC